MFQRSFFAGLPVPLRGMLLFIIAMLCFSVMNVLIRAMADEMNTPQMVFLRNLISLAVMLPWVLLNGISYAKTSRIKGHFLRALFGICAMELWFYSISIMPVTHATAISFTTPLFVTILAILFLGEKVGWRRVSALMTGFIGVFLVLRPDLTSFDTKSLIVLAASLMMAGGSVVIKGLTRTEHSAIIVFYMAVFMCLFSAPFGIYYWETPSVLGLKGIVLIGIASTIAQLCIAHAFTKTELAALMPLDFLRLVFTAAIAYPVFYEVITGPMLLGAMLIVASSAYIAYREKKMKQREDTELPCQVTVNSQ